MDLATHFVTNAGRPLDLTVKEFEISRLLLERAGRVVRRVELMDEVWDPNSFGSTKTLDLHASALRKKLGDDPAAPRYIRTVRGVGFRFRAGSLTASQPTASDSSPKPGCALNAPFYAREANHEPIRKGVTECVPGTR